MDKQQEHRLSIRFPHPVWEQLVELAQDEERSINWEVIQAVRERIARHKEGRKPRGHKDV
jgi:predicted HicB family RNase H-like nuclease